MKSKEFLLSQTLPSCSNHPSSPEQPRSGNPCRSVVLSTNTQPPSSLPTSSPLLLSYLPPLFSLCFTTVSRGHYYPCFATWEEKMSFTSSARLSYLCNLFSFSSSAFSFPVCPNPFALNKIQFQWHAPLQATVSVCNLFLPLFLSRSLFHIARFYSLWFLIGFQSYLSQKQ